MLTRRAALARMLSGGVGLVVGAGSGWGLRQGELDHLRGETSGLQQEVTRLQQELANRDDELQATRRDAVAWRERATRLSYNTASGGGVNLKHMPHPQTGEATVPLVEVFSFDRNHAMCRVDANPQAFKIPTFGMGEVTIEAHHFYMSMVATSIEQYQVSSLSGGLRQVVMRGGLDCSTEVGQAEVTIGSRTAAEHATYRIQAIDAGVGGGTAGDSFAFTVFFDLEEAPVNHAIFGPEFTFTGQMVEGEISIVDPAAGQS